MADYTVGTASLKVRPDAREFVTLLRADMDRVADPGFDVKIHPDMAAAIADIDRFRADQERNALDLDVDVDLAGASSHLDEFRVRQGANPVKMGVTVDRDKLSSEVGAAFSAVGSAVKFPLIFAGIGELPAAATAIASMTGAVQQLAGAGLALPGIFAGIGSSIGTFALATHGMKDALDAIDKSDGSAASLKKIDEAMKGLSPDARDVVTAIAEMKPQFNDLRATVQQNFFAGLSGDIKALVASDFPTLKTGLGGIATAWNQNLHQLTASLGSDSSKGLLDRILGNTAEAQAKFTAAIDPLVHGIGTLTAAGTDTLPRLIDDFDQLAQRFDAFISKADQNGTLDKWLNDGISGFEHLGSIFLDVGKSIASVTQAAGGGDGLLATLDSGASKLADFLGSTRGQDDLKRFFEEGREELQKLEPILTNLGPIAGGLFNAAKESTDAWLPVIKDVTDTLAQDPQLVTDIADAFLAWKFVSSISDVASAVGNLSGGLSAIAGGEAAGAAGALMTEFGPVAALFAGIAAAVPVFANMQFEPDAVRRPDESLDDYLKRVKSEGVQLPTAPPPAPKPDTESLPAVLGGPAAPAPPDPRRVQGPVPYVPPSDPFAPNGLLGGYARGGPTPSGRGNGPTGGFISELHGDEWVLPKHARTAVGDQALWALTQGRSFAPGGYINPDGTPVTPGALPGPAVATPTGGVASLASSFLSGLGGLGGNLGGGLFGNVSGVDRAGGSKLTPGLWGLSQAGSDPNLLGQWGNQTGDWLGKFASKTLLSLGTSLWSGALGIFGLQDSILSPSNPYFQAVAKSAGFYLGDDGPFGSQGGKGSSTKGAPTGKQMREGREKVERSDQRVEEIKQRIAELDPDAKKSQRDSLTNQLANAQQDAQDARTDFAALGGTAGSSGGGSSAPAGYAYGGHQDVADAVWQAYVAAGMPQGEWGDFVKLENSEAGWQPGVRNASSGAYGIAQFLGAGNISKYLGGNSNAPLGVQATGMMRYLQDRYHGSPAAAWQFHLANNWYDNGLWGGEVPTGTSLVHNDTGVNEHMYIATAEQHDALKQGAVIAPPRPNFQTPDANKIAAPGGPRPPAIATPTPPASPSQPPHLVAPPPEQFPSPTGAPQPNIGPAPSNLNHNLQAVNTGIESGAKAIGNIASSAINAAAAAGSFGAGGGGGGAGQFVDGLIQEGGKSVEDAANVVSSFLVGDTSLGSGPNAYGQTAIQPQQQPDTLPYGGPGGPARAVQYGPFYGHNTADVSRFIETKEAQDRQGFYANK